MKNAKKCKKLLSLLLLIIFVFTIFPVNIFADTIVNDNYSEMTDFSEYFGWNVTTAPTHAVFEKTDGGMHIYQTTQTTYDTGTNGTSDGNFVRYINSVVKSDSKNGMQIVPYEKGKVTITIDYVIDQGNESNAANPFYAMSIPGYINLRFYNNRIAVLNAAGYADSTMEPRVLYSSNGAGKAKQIVIEIDTETDKVTVTHGGNSSTGDSINIKAGKAPADAVKSISVRNMQRMNKGAYLKFTSLKVESDVEYMFTLDEASQKLVNSFPTSITADNDNVTENVTLPTNIAGIKWTTSNANVMTKAGKISRTSESDPKVVVLSAPFDVTTTDGKTVTLEVQYVLNVTGLSNRLENTTTINPTEGADESTEKWYTMPERGDEEDGYPMPDDPNYISDEAFFGKWNSTSSKWVKEPYFRYSDYDGMAGVEEAAKEGDYETAKSELLKYYRSLASSRVNSVNSITSSNDKAYKAIYELMSRNAYVTNFISNYVIDTFKIQQEWSDVTIDVTDRLNEAKGSYSIFTNVIASVDKYRNQAEVYSKESDYDPVIVATVNGESVTFNAVKDATLQAGEYSGINYGSEKILYAEEAGTWDNFEDRTKRMFIGFDISGLDRDDTIEDAYIKIKARHTGSDEEKLMAAYWIGESSWLENTICWDTFADHMYFSCNDMNCWDYVTSNITTVKGKVCGYHRGHEPKFLANLYSYYSRHPEAEQYPDKYAYTYIRQYMGLINSIGLEPDVMNQLDMSIHISSVSEDVLRIINSKYMTPEAFTTFMKHFWLLTEYHTYNYYGVASNNFASYSTAAVYNICARFPEFARHDVWTEETVKENDIIVEGFTFDDGMCYELSHNYHSTILDTFALPYTTHNKTGEPLPFSEKTTGIIYDIVMSLFNTSGPYFGGFNLGDGFDPYTSYQSTFKTWYNNLFKNDPTVANIATGGSSGWLPDKYTTNYSVGQRTFMRSDWSEKALALAMTNKMVGSHGHKDALSIAMFAYGKYLLTDQGYGGVQTGNTMYYMKSPQQHNVVTVNDSEDYLVDGYIVSDVRSESYNTLQSVDGEQMYFDTNDQYDFVEYSTPAYTTTENSQRSVMFLKNQKFWIVTDYQVPNDATVENVYAQNWHLYPGAEMTIDPTTKVIESHFEDEPNVMLVPVDPDAIDETEIRGTWYSEKAGQISDSEKGMLYKTKTGNAVFSTVIMPMDVGEDYTITTTKLSNALDEDEVNLFSFTVENEVTGDQSKYYYYHVNDAELNTTVNVGSYSTDANTLLVEEDTSGNVISLYMIDGTFVNKGTATLIKTVDGSVDTLAFTVTDDVLDLHTSEGDISILDNCLINTSLASSVSYEKTYNIPYIVADGMMTFTDVEAALDVTADPNMGTVIYDSDVNPELLNYVTITGSDYYKTTNNLADGGILKFENVNSDIEQTGSGDMIGIIRFSGILDSDTENGTKTISDMMVGKYAIELNMQHNIFTERVDASGNNWPTFVTMYLGNSGENSNGSLRTGGFNNRIIQLRLYNKNINIIRTADTQASGVRNDVNNLAMQVFKPDNEWKLRIVVDTVERTYTIFVNDVLAVGAVEFPYNINTVGNFLPDLAIMMMKANSVGSYVQINNVKIYEIESDEEDTRVVQMNSLLESLPLKLSSGNPALVTSNLTVPTISNVTWASSNIDLIGIDGILNSKVTESTPISFTASSTLSDTEATRTFKFKKIYNMTVVPDNWILTATKSGKTVTASVTSSSEDYSLKPALIIVGYKNDGTLCDIKVEEVTAKLENYSYTLNNETVTIKVFLFDSLNSSVPLVNDILVE